MSQFHTSQKTLTSPIDLCISGVANSSVTEPERNATKTGKHDFWNWPRPSFTASSDSIKRPRIG